LQSAVKNIYFALK